jgi:SecD/SecF fusion protein
MQLKGLVRFFTILLILYSIYELSFTWVVRSHENKMESRAKQFVAVNYASAPQNVKDQVYNERLKRLLDSTKDVTVHYGPTGAISYDRAKREELNLGLDLQGGMNVTLEVELSGLLRSLANNSTDPNFLKALENANTRKANSDADFISLFTEEYKKLAPNAKLAGLFATANQEDIKITSTDAEVTSYLRKAAGIAFDNTFRVLQKRIDQFGVAQPNINPNKERGTITVELPGVDDEARVRDYLQSSANLQFWETYKLEELGNAIVAADAQFNKLMGGSSVDTTQKDTTNNNDTLNKSTGNTYSLTKYIQFAPQSGFIGVVKSSDTAVVRNYLNQLSTFFPADAQWFYGVPNKDNRSQLPLYAIRTGGRLEPALGGEVITKATPTYDNVTGKPVVSMQMNTTGANTWAALTERSAQQQIPIAIVLDDQVYSAPIASEKITGGQSQISGSFTIEEATDLANILNAGKLPAPAKIVQEQTVGPTLGKAALRGGLYAFIISFAVIFLLMLVYYNTSGWVANIALILNLLFTVGILTGLGATLTAPGIAGLVLTIGMAVDTNVLIYERIKEELTRGKSYQAAINDGYRRSLPPVLDGHVTTLLTAIILFSFGLGPVKGFATTQIIGILLSLFCGIAVSRWVTEWFTSKKKHLEYFTPLSRKVFKHANFKFIEKRKIAYAISVVVLIAGIGAIFNGFDEGVEFKGGRSYTVEFGKAVDVEPIRNDLEKTFQGQAPVIKTVGSNSRLEITTSYLIDNASTSTDSVVRATLFTGLKNHLPANADLRTFTNTTRYVVGSNKVLPTISDDLKNGAKWATFWSLLIISLYIFIRFRDWRYSLGTIAALLHDVLVTLAVFSFARNIVPFPLELDQHFIAAILTVIGFSMNDTVVIFDRIREYSRNMRGQSKEKIINAAINDTLSRTIMTSLTVFLTILILFIFGGEVTRGFSFAMLIGVLVGIYSSVFVAAPVLVDLGGKKVLGGDSVAESKTQLKPQAEVAK